jgi:hypothetical protein
MVCPLSTSAIKCWHKYWISSNPNIRSLMVFVFPTRRAAWVRFRSVRCCLNLSHAESYEKKNNYASHKTFTIHCASHMHFQSTDYTEIPTDMNIILYHFPLMHVIPHRQNIYLFLIRDHKPMNMKTTL